MKFRTLHPPMNWKTLILILAPWAGASAAQDVRYERDGDDSFRVDAHGTHLIDPEVITVRFAREVEDFAAFRDSFSDKSSALGRLEVVRENRLGFVDLRVPEGADVLEVLAALRATGLTETCEENVFGAFLETPNDPFFSSQKHLRNTGFGGGTVDADIDADSAWSFTTGDPSIIVAILDSGCDVTHPELSASIWINTSEIPANGVDDDSNGFIDDVNGWDFESNSGALTDSISHGTAVCGVVGARTNNGAGVSGVAGGFGATPGVTVMPVKVATTVISSAIVDDAILYAADNGAHVINMSFMVSPTGAINSAITSVHDVDGILLVAAAGNSLAPVSFPASHVKVLSIAGTDDEDQRWSPGAGTGSNFGPENWISASADAIWSTGAGGTILGLSGTSFASPQVAAAAGLMLSIMPSLSPEDMAEILKITADDVEAAGFDDLTGWGRLNLYAAVLHVASSDCNNNGLYDPREIADGLVLDLNLDGVPDDCDYSSFCFGNDDGAACTPCPCGNAAPSGARAGCENESGGSCALLVSGVPSVGTDTLRFEIEGAQPMTLAILASADNALPTSGPCAPGTGVTSVAFDGLRCIGANLLRHGGRMTDSTGEALTPWDAVSGPVGGIAMNGSFSAGQVRNFQVIYRDNAGGGCGTGLNTSNAVRVEFLP